MFLSFAYLFHLPFFLPVLSTLYGLVPMLFLIIFLSQLSMYPFFLAYIFFLSFALVIFIFHFCFQIFIQCETRLSKIQSVFIAAASRVSQQLV